MGSILLSFIGNYGGRLPLYDEQGGLIDVVVAPMAAAALSQPDTFANANPGAHQEIGM